LIFFLFFAFSAANMMRQLLFSSDAESIAIIMIFHFRISSLHAEFSPATRPPALSASSPLADCSCCRLSSSHLYIFFFTPLMPAFSSPMPRRAFVTLPSAAVFERRRTMILRRLIAAATMPPAR